MKFSLSLVMGALATTCCAARNSTACSTTQLNPDGTMMFSPFNTIHFYDSRSVLHSPPCMEIEIAVNNECIPLDEGSIAAKAQNVIIPASGHWGCKFFHEKHCESDDFLYLHSNGPPLPLEWAGKIGAFQCYNDHWN